MFQEHLELWHYIQRSVDLLLHSKEHGSSSRDSTWEATLVLLGWGWAAGGGESEGEGEGEGDGEVPRLSRWRPLLELQVGHNMSEPRLRTLTRWKALGDAFLETDCNADGANGCGEYGELFCVLSSHSQLREKLAILCGENKPDA